MWDVTIEVFNKKKAKYLLTIFALIRRQNVNTHFANNLCDPERAIMWQYTAKMINKHNEKPLDHM